ncbi:hypothetical protein ACF06T_30290 [Streptomyces albidoflavus]
MSTSLNLAPGQTPPGAAPQPPTTQPPTQNPTPKKTKTPDPSPDPHGTVGGVIIPGAALSSFIGLCWLIHQYGLPAVLLGVVACAIAATGALILRASRSRKRSPLRSGGFFRSGGGGGGPGPRPPKLPRSGGGQRSTLGSLGASNRAAGRNAPRSSGAGRTGGTLGGGAGRGAGNRSNGLGSLGGGTRKSTGPFSQKTSGSLGKTNQPRTNTPSLNKRSSGSILAPHRTPTTNTGAGGGAGKTGRGSGNGKHRKHSNNGHGTGRGGLLSRIHNRRTAPLKNPKGPKGPKLPKNNSAGNGGTLSPHKPGKQPYKNKPLHTPTRPLTKKAAALARAMARAAKRNNRTRPRRTKPNHLKATPKTPAHLRGAKARRYARTIRRATAPRRLRARALHHARRGTYLVGVKARKHLPYKIKLRLRHANKLRRAITRRAGRLISKPLAHAYRTGARWFLKAHLRLGTRRYTAAGPNWMRPLTRLLHVVTSPAARLVSATGSWTWLNKWIYRHTTPGALNRVNPNPQQHAPSPAGPTAPTVPTQRNTITPPHLSEGTILMAQAAQPLDQAIEAITSAGAQLLTNPADNMLGYEAVLHRLSEVQAAISGVLTQAAESTRENFKVNPAIAEAYNDYANYSTGLSDRLADIPTMYRSLHAEQIDNIENPTIQARKWDIASNEHGA